MANLFQRLQRAFAHDIAIDLGTANTLVALPGHGVVIEEPSVVAINQRNQQILAVGNAAKKMAGRTPGSIVVVRPLRDGVISDFDATEAMIRYFIQQIYREYGKFYQLNRPRVVIGVPSLITEVEVRAVMDAAKLAGARSVFIVEEPIAAAIGVGMAVEEVQGSMIIDIGGGTTDIALISMGGMVADNTIKIAGDELDTAICDYIKHKYNLLISESMGEEIKMEIGSAYKLTKEKEMQISGRDLTTGLPKTIKIGSIEVREAMMKVIDQIVAAARSMVESAPPEVVTDLVRHGVVVAGGGALIPGIDKYLASKLKLQVKIAENPGNAVVVGVAALLENVDLLAKLQVKERSFI